MIGLDQLLKFSKPKAQLSVSTATTTRNTTSCEVKEIPLNVSKSRSSSNMLPIAVKSKPRFVNQAFVLNDDSKADKKLPAVGNPSSQNKKKDAEETKRLLQEIKSYKNKISRVSSFQTPIRRDLSDSVSESAHKASFKDPEPIKETLFDKQVIVPAIDTQDSVQNQDLIKEKDLEMQFIVPVLHTQEVPTGPTGHNMSATGVRGTACDRNIVPTVRSTVDKVKYKCNKCSVTFSYKARYELHLSKDKCCASFSCARCNATFTEEKNLRRHQNKVCGIFVECTVCKKKFPNESRLDQHTKYCHTPLKCRYCKKSLKNGNTRRSHEFKCKGKVLSQVEMTSINQEKGVVCISKTDSGAGEVAGSSGNLNISSSTSKSCGQCKLVFTSEIEYFRHNDLHLNNIENSVTEAKNLDTVSQKDVVYNVRNRIYRELEFDQF